MKIPSDLSRRQVLYSEVASACLASRANRVADYATREAYYLYGSNSGAAPAEFNRTFSCIKNLKAFIYAADSTQFTLDVGADTPHIEITRVPVVSRYLNQTWKGSNSDQVASQCVEWALVYNTMIMKSMWVVDSFRTYAIRPHDFGVYDESIDSMDDQEAMVHVYSIGLDELKRRIEFLPNREAILRNVQPQRSRAPDAEDGLSRLILTASAPITPTNPNAVGALANTVFSQQASYNAKTDIETVELYEMWVWNDDKEDYQVVTMCGNQPMIDRLSGEEKHGRIMYPKGENPFTKFTPSPKFNYFWGISDVQSVIVLQESLNSRFVDFDDLLEKNVRPPTSGYGYQEEAFLALMSPGGQAYGIDPNATVQQHTPQIPEELLKRIDMIYGGFDDALALSNVLQGKGEAGVRGRGHAQELARISSARIKEKALSTEDSLEKAATLQLRLQEVYDDTALDEEANSGGKSKFTLAQMTPSMTVKVDAHSNSPLFADDTRELANEMFDKEIIDGKAYIDLVKPQNPEVLKLRYDELKRERQEREMMMASMKQGAPATPH